MDSAHRHGTRKDSAREWAAGTSCNKCTRSQPAAELVCLDHPTQYIRKFLIIVDRHSAWSPEHNGGKEEGTQGLNSALNNHLATLGISMEITSDRG